jgi:hypothetical protein
LIANDNLATPLWKATGHYSIQRAQQPTTIDGFEYRDSPLNHDWKIYDPAGTLSTVSGAGRPGRVMRATTNEGTGFGIKYPPSGSLDLPYHAVSVWIKDTNLFFFYVRVHATNGSTYFLRYQPTDGAPSSNSNYAFIRVGSPELRKLCRHLVGVRRLVHPGRSKAIVEHIRIDVGPVFPCKCALLDLHCSEHCQILPHWLENGTIRHHDSCAHCNKVAFLCYNRSGHRWP